jgi:hypothetical protein
MMHEPDLKDIIEALDLADLGGDAEAIRVVLRRSIEVFSGIGKAVGEEFHVKVPPNFDMSQLDCPQHLRSEKERVPVEAEVTRLMTLGVIEPSDALASTNLVFVAKKMKDAAGKQEQRTAIATGHWKSTSLRSRTATPCPPWKT